MTKVKGLYRNMYALQASKDCWAPIDTVGNLNLGNIMEGLEIAGRRMLHPSTMSGDKVAALWAKTKAMWVETMERSSCVMYECIPSAFLTTVFDNYYYNQRCRRWYMCGTELRRIAIRFYPVLKHSYVLSLLVLCMAPDRVAARLADTNRANKEKVVQKSGSYPHWSHTEPRRIANAVHNSKKPYFQNEFPTSSSSTICGTVRTIIDGR